MSKTIHIKLTKAGINSGPFSIYDQNNNLIFDNIPRLILINGISYIVENDVTLIKLVSTGKCAFSKTKSVVNITENEFSNLKLDTSVKSCVWKHLKNPKLYNSFYGTIYPYIIEYPFTYQYQDEVLQNVKDYTKAYKYLNSVDDYLNTNNKVETNDVWFNKAVVYNGQQSSGILELVPKPLNNMREYMKYPIYKSDGKVITFTKSDNFYQYNTFWSVVKDRTVPLFASSCENLSIDKVINQINMDYSHRSFKKEPLRAKDLRVRHILDNRDDALLVSQFIYSPAQNSYK